MAGVGAGEKMGGTGGPGVKREAVLKGLGRRGGGGWEKEGLPGASLCWCFLRLHNYVTKEHLWPSGSGTRTEQNRTYQSVSHIVKYSVIVWIK